MDLMALDYRFKVIGSELTLSKSTQLHYTLSWAWSLSLQLLLLVALSLLSSVKTVLNFWKIGKTFEE